ncbi:MAG: PAS domain S-box protein, partial [Candidatus Obscuribacterales bacterium]|nr:PAS domain S-box protein [Steroidobacteraceae bacterium]
CAWIAMRETQTAPLTMVARCGGTSDFGSLGMQRINSTPNHPGPAGRALRDGVVAISNDIANDATFYFKERALALGKKSCAIFPMRIAGETCGIMAMYSAHVNYFHDEELRVLTALADDISFAVESAAKEVERKQALDTLQENQRVHATLLGNLPGMVYRSRNDASWTIEFASDGCLELTGYTPQQFYDNDVCYERIILPIDRQMVRDAVEKALAVRKPFELVYRIITAEGQQKWIWERGNGVYDGRGKVRFLEGFATDITARREAEQQVAAQAALLDKAKDAIVLFGIDDTVYYWNYGAERLYGWRADEALGKKITTLSCRDTQARRELLTQLQTNDEWSGELTAFNKSGGEIVIDASWTLVRDELGNPASVLTINTDITDRKRLEARVLNAQRIESLGTLAGGIAHDFNNILAAIAGNAKLVLIDLPATHALYAHVREIEKASRRATELVRQILTFSQQQFVSRQLVKLPDIADESLRLLRATLPPQIEIQKNYVKDSPLVTADPTQLHQVLINLGTNAAHAMAQGGVLNVRLEEVLLDARSKEVSDDLPVGRYACLAVSDTGVGMDAATQARIFEPFFTTKPAGQGTGLGLAVVHGIVRSHGGSITVRSELGSGSVFKVYFPVVASSNDATIQDAARADVVGTAELQGQGQRVLYVDDEEALVFLATRVLERLGYEVTGRCDAVQALAEFRADPQRFDAVVSDLSMPGMSGPEFASAVRKLRGDIPIVMTSGYIREQDLNAVRELGIRELVLKPNTVEELGETLHRVLAKK